jgi:omega-6 fatty acid desaturase (delta-12 desaturase)
MPVLRMNPSMEQGSMPDGSGPPPETAGWKAIVRKYQDPCPAASAWQMVNTLGPYVLLWTAMYFALRVSWWLAAPLAILAGAFLVRTFILFHDCTHGSFFKSRRANDTLGFLTGVLTFTPYHHWRWLHSAHHSSWGIWTAGALAMSGP